MKRLIDWHLEKWKMDQHRKPLIIRGARQVGKTYAVRNLAGTFENSLEINFELTPDAKSIFAPDLKPERIIRDLSLYSGCEISPRKTLVFFDEIQECPDAIQSLRYFFETVPELHVVAAGSLLDFAIEKIGVPVGRLSNLYMYPLSFIEFLAATGNNLLIQAILDHELYEPVVEAIHTKLLNLVGQYVAIGGMPEVVGRWRASNNPKECFEVHHQLVEAYRQDFQKYSKKSEIKYVDQLFNQIPRLIGEQFQYKRIHGEYRKRELAPCLDLLCNANVVHRVLHSAGNGVPLGAESNMEWFKLIFLDVALCQAILGLDLSTWFLKPGVEFINRRDVAEAFTGQELLCYSSPYKKNELYFWKREQRGSQAEVDFLYERLAEVIPIEVKASHGRTLKSMHLFLESHPNVQWGVRFSHHNYSVMGKVHSKPLYDVVSLAHEDQQGALRSLV